MTSALKRHWPEYVIEASGLALLAMVVGTFAVALFHPDSLVVEVLPSALARHVIMGLVVGTASISLVYSPWGKQSGAHFNPAVTLTYCCLGKVGYQDAVWYMIAQVGGALFGIIVVSIPLGMRLAHPMIHFAASQPGVWGPSGTWAVEFVLSGLLMSVILMATNSRLAHWTGIFTALITVFNVAIIVPLIGTSLNPARSLASAVPAHLWSHLWIYLTAAPSGMLAAAFVYVRQHGADAVFCAKLHHDNQKRCIFCLTRAERKTRENVTAACNPSSCDASKREITPGHASARVPSLEPVTCRHSTTTM